MYANNFPVEIWRQIFREAVHVPTLLDTSWDYQPSQRLWEGWGLTNDSQIATKRIIVQVCREWKEIGEELLYEVIQIPTFPEDRCYERIDILVEAFQNSEAASDSKHGHGWWTKRIDCPLELLTPTYVGRLFSLLNQCHNLQIFTVYSDGEIDRNTRTRLAGILQSRFMHSLRRMDWILDDLDGDLDPNTLSNARLTSLRMRIREPFQDIHLHLSLESITTLILCLPTLPLQLPPQWHFPHLRTLALTDLEGGDFSALRSFLLRHSSTLFNLHIETTESRIEGYPLLIGGYPNLRALSFDDFDLRWLGLISKHGDEEPLLPIQGVEYLGVIRISSRTAVARVREGIRLILDHRAFLQLKVIRMLRERNPIYSARDDWSEAITLCKDYNVRLEDMYGTLLYIAEEQDHDGRGRL